MGRIRNRDYVAYEHSPDQWFSAKTLYKQAKRKPVILGSALWVRKHPLKGMLLIVHRQAKGRKDKNLSGEVAKNAQSRKQAKRENEPWLLVASPSLSGYSAKEIMAFYKTRMQIEEGFRDTKNHQLGLGLARHHVVKSDRLRNLLLIAALASLLLWLIGSAIKAQPIARQIQVNTSTLGNVYSVIFLARLSIRYTRFRIKVIDIINARKQIFEYYAKLGLAP